MRMNALPVKKELLSFIPEIVFGLVTAYGIVDNLLFRSIDTTTYIAIGFLTVLLISAIWKNPIFGCIVANIIILVSIFFLLAVISEYIEFSSGDARGIRMLIVGCTIFGTSTVLGFLMARKYASK